jgi:hypothetical protein
MNIWEKRQMFLAAQEKWLDYQFTFQEEWCSYFEERGQRPPPIEKPMDKLDTEIFILESLAGITGKQSDRQRDRLAELKARKKKKIKASNRRTTRRTGRHLNAL